MVPCEQSLLRKDRSDSASRVQKWRLQGRLRLPNNARSQGTAHFNNFVSITQWPFSKVAWWLTHSRCYRLVLSAQFLLYITFDSNYSHFLNFKSGAGKFSSRFFQFVLIKVLNPFYPCPFYRLWRHQFCLSRITLSVDFCRVKRSFKPYQNGHNSVEDNREKGKKTM